MVDKKKIKILDVVCGTGLSGFSLRKFGFKNIDGLDLSDSGTLTSSFKKHDLVRSKFERDYSFNIPKTNRASIKIGTKINTIISANM